MSQPPPATAKQPKVPETMYAEARRRRRRALAVLVLAALLVAVGSFVLASKLLKSDKGSASSPDAGARTPSETPR